MAEIISEGVQVAATERADYRRIAAEIQAQIESGALKSGDKLPSTAALAAREGVSTSTVYRALSLLHDRDLVEGHSGKGVYVK